MLEAFWIALNLLIGVPIAVALIVVLREAVRGTLALAFGFRVFEIKWAVGRPLIVKSIGPVNLIIGRIPFAASTTCESGSPRYHRIGRLAQAAGPLIIQTIFALSGHREFIALTEAVRGEFSLIAALQLANLLLLATHGLLPIESRSGFRTDIRSILNIGFGPADVHRNARARYYARSAKLWIERSDVDRAKAVLEQGLTQLGRDALLVSCEEQIASEDLSSIIDQDRCASALNHLIEQFEIMGERSRASWPIRKRLRQTALNTLPVTFASLGLLVFHAESLSNRFHHHLFEASNGVVNRGQASECEAHLDRWSRWTPFFDALMADSQALLRDREVQLAGLERCRGHLDSARAHYAAATGLAVEIVGGPGGQTDGHSSLGLVHILRKAALLEKERGRFRLALAGFRRAETEVARARLWLDRTHDPDGKARANLDREEIRIGHARDQMIAGMNAQ
jgi:hypothetical protein